MTRSVTGSPGHPGTVLADASTTTANIDTTPRTPSGEPATGDADASRPAQVGPLARLPEGLRTRQGSPPPRRGVDRLPALLTGFGAAPGADDGSESPLTAIHRPGETTPATGLSPAQKREQSNLARSRVEEWLADPRNVIEDSPDGALRDQPRLDDIRPGGLAEVMQGMLDRMPRPASLAMPEEDPPERPASPTWSMGTCSGPASPTGTETASSPSSDPAPETLHLVEPQAEEPTHPATPEMTTIDPIPLDDIPPVLSEAASRALDAKGKDGRPPPLEARYRAMMPTLHGDPERTGVPADVAAKLASLKNGGAPRGGLWSSPVRALRTLAPVKGMKAVAASAQRAQGLVSGLFSEKNDPLGWLSVPQEMTFKDSQRIKQELKEFFRNYEDPSKIDLREIGRHLVKDTIPVVRASVVYAASNYAASVASDYLLAGRKDSVPPASEKTASLDLNAEREREQAENAERAKRYATDIRPFVKDVAAETIRKGAAIVVGDLIQQSGVLQVERDMPDDRGAMGRVYKTFKKLYAERDKAQPTSVREQLRRLDLDFDFYMGAQKLNAEPVEEMIDRRLALSHSHPKPKHDLAYLKSPEVVGRLDALKSTLRKQTADDLQKHLFNKLGDPDAPVLFINLHSNQPGGGKSHFSGELGKALDRPVIKLTDVEFLNHFWDTARDDWGRTDYPLESAAGKAMSELIKAGRSDVIFHVDEMDLPEAERDIKNVMFKINADPTQRLFNNGADCPVNFIFVLTSQFSTNHIPAALERAPSVELRAEEPQRMTRAHEVLEDSLASVDASVREPMRALALSRLEAIRVVTNAMDCGLRLVRDLVRNMLVLTENDVRGGTPPSRHDFETELLDYASQLIPPRFKESTRRVRSLSQGVKSGGSIADHVIPKNLVEEKGAGLDDQAQLD